MYCQLPEGRATTEENPSGHMLRLALVATACLLGKLAGRDVTVQPILTSSARRGPVQPPPLVGKHKGGIGEKNQGFGLARGGQGAELLGAIEK